MNKFTLTIIAAMFSVNAFAATAPAAPGFGQKDEPAKSSHTTSCPFSKQKNGRHEVSKHSRQAAVTTVVASNSDKAADSNGKAKK